MSHLAAPVTGAEQPQPLLIDGLLYDLLPIGLSIWIPPERAAFTHQCCPRPELTFANHDASDIKHDLVHSRTTHLPSHTCIMDGQLEKEPSSGLTFYQDDVLPDRRLEDLKREQIEQACKHSHLKELVHLATSPGGLLDDHLRQSACMTGLFLASSSAKFADTDQGHCCLVVASVRAVPGNQML